MSLLCWSRGLAEPSLSPSVCEWFSQQGEAGGGDPADVPTGEHLLVASYQRCNIKNKQTKKQTKKLYFFGLKNQFLLWSWKSLEIWQNSFGNMREWNIKCVVRGLVWIFFFIFIMLCLYVVKVHVMPCGVHDNQKDPALIQNSITDTPSSLERLVQSKSSHVGGWLKNKALNDFCLFVWGLEGRGARACCYGNQLVGFLCLCLCLPLSVSSIRKS